jgi:hypothetical protein
MQSAVLRLPSPSGGPLFFLGRINFPVSEDAIIKINPNLLTFTCDIIQKPFVSQVEL